MTSALTIVLLRHNSSAVFYKEHKKTMKCKREDALEGIFHMIVSQKKNPKQTIHSKGDHKEMSKPKF